MKLKLVATLSLLAMGSIGTAMAAGSLDQQVASLQAQINQLKAQVNNSAPASANTSLVGFYSPLTWQLMDNTVGTGSEVAILNARQAGNLANGTVYLGGLAKADAFYRSSSVDGSYASNRAHASIDAPGGSLSSLQLTQVSMDVVANINAWATGYMQLSSYNLGNNVIDSTTGEKSGDAVRVDRAYLLLGNLSQSPVYGLVGKNTVNFGDFSTVNMYAQPLSTQAFLAQANQAEVAYSQNGFNSDLTLLNSGSGGTGLYTNGNQLNNFALNLGYGANNNGVNWKVGAGYLNGSNFSSAWSSTTHSGQRNAAWDVNGKVAVGAFGMQAEYVSTVDNFVNNHTVDAFDVGGNYAFQTMGSNSVVSLDYSKLNMGGSANFDQYVAGFRNEVANNVWAGVEYTYNSGVFNGAANGGLISSNANSNNNTLALDLTAAF